MYNKGWKKHSYVTGINNAINGIIEAIRTEYHMKFHCFCTVLVIAVSIFMNLPKTDILALSTSITLVWVAELFNTALETCVDMITSEYSLKAKRAKDIASGAVFITAINAITVGFFVYEKTFEFQFKESFYRIRNSNFRIAIVIFAVIILLVISLKMLFKHGTPMKGGMPSGHSALAASLFTIIACISDNYRVFILGFLLLVLVLQSRIEGKIHSLLETVLGAFIGWSVTYLLLCFFRNRF